MLRSIPLSASNTFSLVIGDSLNRIPTALYIAFDNAGGTGISTASPIPLAPKGHSLWGTPVNIAAMLALLGIS